MPQHRSPGRLDPELAKELNEHVSLEAQSAFFYLSLASWAEVRGLTGFAQWFRGEADGELQHMRLFVSHLNDRGFQATYGDLPAPESSWETMQDLFERVVEVESRLCDKIESLIELSHSRRDHFTGSFLQGFVPQQIADMAKSDEISDRLKLVGDDGQGVLLIDQELRSLSGGRG